VALVERDGKIRTQVVEHVNAGNLKAAIRENVSKQATIHTDELNLYQASDKNSQVGIRPSITVMASMPVMKSTPTRPSHSLLC